jgi:hypothetical protein
VLKIPFIVLFGKLRMLRPGCEAGANNRNNWSLKKNATNFIELEIREGMCMIKGDHYLGEQGCIVQFPPSHQVYHFWKLYLSGQTSFLRGCLDPIAKGVFG